MSENPLVGVWKLVACEAIRTNGSLVPIYGKRPVGRLYYDAQGNMSVHIMRAGRAPSLGETKFAASDEEMKAAYEGYEAYFSKYKLDQASGTVSHKVVGSLFPNWTGSIQHRYYEIDSRGQLILSTAPIGSSPNGKTIVKLTWERLEE